MILQRLLIVMGMCGAAGGLTACSEDVDSENIRTAGIYAAMTIKSATENTADVEVTLKTGGSGSNTYLNLTGGDALTATLNNSASQVLSKYAPNPKEISYRTTFSANPAGVENSTYKIAFNRSANDVSAPDSSVTIPASAADLAVSSANFSRTKNAIGLTWSAQDATKHLDLDINGSCIQGYTTTILDAGTYTVNPGTLTGKSSDTCNVTFTLSRSVNGTLDKGYGEGGYIKATVFRSVTASSAP